MLAFVASGLLVLAMTPYPGLATPTDSPPGTCPSCEYGLAIPPACRCPDPMHPAAKGRSLAKKFNENGRGKPNRGNPIRGKSDYSKP